MTVKELIEALSRLDPELPVVYTEYADGEVLIDQVKVLQTSSFTGEKYSVAMLVSNEGAF